MASSTWFSMLVSIVLTSRAMTSCWVFRAPQLFRPLRWQGLKANKSAIRSRRSRLYSASAPTVATSSSDTSFFTHVVIQKDGDGLSISRAIRQSVGEFLAKSNDGEEANMKPTSTIDDVQIVIPTRNQRLSPLQLLKLGSVWYLSAAEVEHNDNVPADQPHLFRHKPQRLSLCNSTLTMQKGDYLRIHHTPRRFTRVYEQNWASDHSSTNSSSSTSTLHQIIVKKGDGFFVIDKPPLVPVHATVDNLMENCVHQLDKHNHDIDYVTATQRLDINTSGLLVVATKPEFASYFAQLLRRKTKQLKKQPRNTTSNINNTTSDATADATFLKTDDESNIQKGYKCLVCIPESSSSSQKMSVVQNWQGLKDMENSVIQHFLESSDRAPKRFESMPPPPSSISADETSSNKWLECLLRIKNVSPLVPIPTPKSPLAQALWTESATSIPPNVKAVAEVDIQLLTGRTHQIRGQLSKLGFPIVGDEQYGGAIPKDTTNNVELPELAQLLALQCCAISFRDANYEQVWNRKRKREITQGFPTDRWIEVALHQAWWAPHVKSSSTTLDEDDSQKITSTLDLELLKDQQKRMDEVAPLQAKETERIDLLPPSIQLSPGKNKYVLIKVLSSASDDSQVYWFVKSASPKECGGPYHANVAQDWIEWIQAAGFSNIQVTGGGRIDYDAARQRAHVYGFSYGYGKGNHAKAAELIESQQEQDITATYDTSDSLY